MDFLLGVVVVVVVVRAYVRKDWTHLKKQGNCCFRMGFLLGSRYLYVSHKLQPSSMFRPEVINEGFLYGTTAVVWRLVAPLLNKGWLRRARPLQMTTKYTCTRVGSSRTLSQAISCTQDVLENTCDRTSVLHYRYGSVGQTTHTHTTFINVA